MLLEHRGKSPRIDASAYVAPNATICGDVTIGAHTQVLFGAVITAAGGPVRMGANCVVMENAVLRGSPGHPLFLGDNVLVGPHAHVTGCSVDADAFLATGCSVFTGARVGSGAEVRINGVVHINSVLPPNETVPIGWVAVGDPCSILPPGEHDKIWTIQERLDFPGTVFGRERLPGGKTLMPDLMSKYAASLGRHHGKDKIKP